MLTRCKNAISATAGIVFRFTRRRCYRALTVALAGLSCFSRRRICKPLRMRAQRHSFKLPRFPLPCFRSVAPFNYFLATQTLCSASTLTPRWPRVFNDIEEEYSRSRCSLIARRDSTCASQVCTSPRLQISLQSIMSPSPPAAQPGQIRSTDHRNGTPATRCDINRVVCHCRRRRPAARL